VCRHSRETAAIVPSGPTSVMTAIGPALIFFSA
jgi:hypothetical protein